VAAGDEGERAQGTTRRGGIKESLTEEEVATGGNQRKSLSIVNPHVEIKKKYNHFYLCFSPYFLQGKILSGDPRLKLNLPVYYSNLDDTLG
jgi:hypothetical protein